MSLPELHLHKGASVLMTVDGHEALGILSFAPSGAAVLTTLCFVNSGCECPILQHELSSAEIETLTAENRNRLISNVSLSSKDERLLAGER